MNTDCQWIDRNLEALFCDGLTADEDRLAREHIESCERCRKEIAELNAMDSLVKQYFEDKLAHARQPRPVPRWSWLPVTKVIGLGTVAAAAIVVFILAVVPRQPQATTSAPGPVAPAQVQVGPSQAVEAPPTTKRDGFVSAERAKPSSAAADASAPSQSDRVQSASSNVTVDSNAPDFIVTDPAGYSRTLEDYRGHILLIGVWETNQSASIASLERLYKTFGGNARIRFVAVSNERQSRPVNTTFPVFHNQGSRLLGAAPGEFILLDEAGTVRLRGSLVKDFEQLRDQLQAQ